MQYTVLPLHVRCNNTSDFTSQLTGREQESNFLTANQHVRARIGQTVVPKTTAAPVW